MITGATRVTAVLGWPVEHSRSPAIMNAAFAAASVDAVMIPVGVPPDRFAAAIAGLRAIGMIGASVTSPHKLAAAALCDERSPAAQAIGAVNCLHVDGDRLVGHNTDEQGFFDGLVAAGFAPGGAHAVILGAGGAARAIAYALRGAGTLDVFARDPSGVTWTTARPWTGPELGDAFARAELVVDCTPVGFEPEHEAGWVDGLPLDRLRPAAWVATLVYHRPTMLVERARARGHATLDGRAMLVHQAARAFAIWTGKAAPATEMAHALDLALAGT